MVRTAMAALVVAFALCACATPSDDASAAREDKVYRTGSNIPVRDHSASDAKTLDPASIERERDLDRMRDVGRRSIGGTK